MDPKETTQKLFTESSQNLFGPNANTFTKLFGGVASASQFGKIEIEGFSPQFGIGNAKMASPPKGLFSATSTAVSAASQNTNLFDQSQVTDLSNTPSFSMVGDKVKEIGPSDAVVSSSGLFQDSMTRFPANQPNSNVFATAKRNENQFSFTSPSTPKAKIGDKFSKSDFGTAASSETGPNDNSLNQVETLSKVATNVQSPPKGLFSSSNPSFGSTNVGFSTNKNFPSLFKEPTSATSPFPSSGAVEGRRKRLFDSADASKQEDEATSAIKRSQNDHTGPSAPGKRLIRNPQFGHSGIFGVAQKLLHKESSSSETASQSRIRRKSSSSSSPLIETAAIQCTKVPRECNDKDNLRRHFSRFGQIIRVRPNPLKNSATVVFSSSEEAALAKEKGKSFMGRQIHIYLYRSRASSTDKSPLQQKLSTSRVMNVAHKVPTTKPPPKRTSVVSKSSKSSRSLLATTNAEKLTLLDKIDKRLRSKIVKESDLSKAVVAMGTCPDMCPEKERYLRLQKNLLSSYEMGPGRTMEHSLVVKEYSRSSADQEEPLPHELRPSSVLRVTMDYLLTHVMRAIDYEKTAEWYDFVWNRTRAIRKEISIQQLSDPLAIEVTEECARFHICCAHELCEMDVSNFDPKINNENLEKTMKTVLDMYEDARRRKADTQPPHEAEFQSYFILLNINRSSDVLRAVKKMKEEIRYSDEVRLAVSAFSALHSNNYSRFFAVVDQASYLQASLLHRYFKQVRQQATRIMAKAYTSKPQCSIPVDDVVRSLRFNDVLELESFCASHDINVLNGQVVLLRAVDYSAEGLSLFCSRDISCKMASRELCDVIANGRQPSSDIVRPSSSFDQEGFYIGPYKELLTAPASLKSTAASPSKATAQVPAQDTSLAEIYEALKQKGISNDVVKNIAKDLFFNVIQETSLDLAEKELLASHYLSMSDHVSVEILNQAVEMELRKVASDAILFEKMEAERRQQEAEEAEQKRQEELRKREEEERKRVELDRKMKELAECIDRAGVQVARDVENEVTSQLARDTALEVFEEEQLNQITAAEADRLLNATVVAELRGVAADCVKTETKRLHSKLSGILRTKLTAIRWAKWRQQLEKLRLHRLSCQLFPCTSLSRDIHQQISDLLPSDQRKSLAEAGAESLALQPFAKLLDYHVTLRDDVTKRIPVIESIHYDVLPFNDIVYNSTHEKATDVFWKVSLAATAANESKWLSWLHHKFGFRSKQSSAFNSTMVEDRAHDQGGMRSCVCCKMLSGDDRMKSEMFGSNSLVVLVTDDDPCALETFLPDVLRSLPPIPRIPVLVLAADYQLDEDTLAGMLRGHPVISSFRLLHFASDDFALNCSKLLSGVKWLASNSTPPPGLRCCRLRELLESQLSRHYIPPLYRDLGRRTKQGLPSLDPYFIREIYNKILGDICACLTDPRLLGVSWPAHEFLVPKFRGTTSFPSENWNTKEEFLKLENLFDDLKLPILPDLHSCDDVSDVEKQMAKYCYEVCPEQHHLALSVSRSIESFAGANELEDGVSFFHQFPWQRLVDAVASSVFERVVYTEAGDLVVGYFEESLERIALPQRFVTDASRVEFDDMDWRKETTLDPMLGPTQHSLACGAASNLKKIVEVSTLRNYSSTIDWIESDDVMEQSANHVSLLKDEIRSEIEDSERFERDLESIIASGEEFLGRFTT